MNEWGLVRISLAKFLRRHLDPSPSGAFEVDACTIRRYAKLEEGSEGVGVGLFFRDGECTVPA